MLERKEIVSVLFYYDGGEEYARPVRLLWDGVDYELGPVQFWHTTNHEKRLVHHYRLTDTDHRYQFVLALETDNLTWALEHYESLPSQPVLGSVKLKFMEA